MNTFVKIAIVDMVRVLDQTKLGLAGAKQIEALYENQQRELAPLLAAARTAKRQNEPAVRQLEQRARDQEAERERLRAELRQSLLSRAQPLVDQIATDAGADLAVARAPAIIFVRPELDLTDRVIAALDKLA